MLIKVFSVLSMLSKLPPVKEGGGATGLLNKGGGRNRLPGLVTKQAVEFPQVQASKNECTHAVWCKRNICWPDVMINNHNTLTVLFCLLLF